MGPGEQELLYLAVAVAAGAVGALVGVGGGVILVPILTLAHVDVRLAMGASLVSVIATSSGAASAYVREHLTNLRVAIFLEMFTTSGALAGALLQGLFSASTLDFFFAGALLLSGVGLLVPRRARPRDPTPADGDRRAPSGDPRAPMAGRYRDPATGEDVAYRIRRLPLGSALMFIAGSASGLLGIGSGALKVPAMDLALGMPLKASSATSDFMIGVTAVASLGAYLARGQLVPALIMPVALGTALGSFVGTRLLARLRSRSVQRVFLVVLAAMAAEMIARGVHG